MAENWNLVCSINKKTSHKTNKTLTNLSHGPMVFQHGQCLLPEMEKKGDKETCCLFLVCFLFVCSLLLLVVVQFILWILQRCRLMILCTFIHYIMLLLWENILGNELQCPNRKGTARVNLGILKPRLYTFISLQALLTKSPISSTRHHHN